MKICICGGGNIGLVCAGYLGSRKDVELTIFTRNPSLWANELEVTDPHLNYFYCHPTKISSNAEEVIPNSDIVLLCLPGFAIESTLKEIQPYVNENNIMYAYPPSKKIYHKKNCPLIIQNESSDNVSEIFINRTDAALHGYYPCVLCRP